MRCFLTSWHGEALLTTADHRRLLVVRISLVGHRLNDGDEFTLVLLRLLQIVFERIHTRNEHIDFFPITALLPVGSELTFFQISLLKLSLHNCGKPVHTLIDPDKKLSDAINECIERSAHVLLKLEDDSWFLADGLQERSLENIVSDGDKLLILSIQGVYLSQDRLVLRVTQYHH